MGQLCEHCGCDAESVRQERLIEELDARLAERLQAEEFEVLAGSVAMRPALRNPHRPSPGGATGTGDTAGGPSFSLHSQRSQTQDRPRQPRNVAQAHHRAPGVQAAQGQQVPHMMSHFLPGMSLNGRPQGNGRGEALGMLGELFGQPGRNQHQVRDPAVLFELFGDLEAVSRGVDPGVIQARTTTMIYEGNSRTACRGDENSPQSQCCVCLENFKPGEELRMLPCMHRYHKECIDRWLARSPACPVCKYDISR